MLSQPFVTGEVSVGPDLKSGPQESNNVRSGAPRRDVFLTILVCPTSLLNDR